MSATGSQVIAVVTFYSRGGSTETLATAAAVGAVQARAGIRMRRLSDVDPAAVIQRFPEHADALRRMHKEYVPPREADIVAADVLLLATPPEVDATSDVWAPYLDMLRRLHAQGALHGKVAAVVDTSGASASLASVLQQVGLAPVAPDVSGASDAVARATALGRAAVAAARALRTA